MEIHNQTADIATASPKALLSMDSLPYELKYELFIAAELYTLRMAYPVQARKFTEREVSRTNELWAEIFAGADLRQLHKAIIRFIATDRKAFFPSPGQIIGVLEDIAKEEEAEERHKATEAHWARVAEQERRVAMGENCATCRFCEHRQVQAGRFDGGEKDADGYISKLFCQNPNSYKYEGEYGHGTAASILCEHYKPLILIEG
jgi:hypothetical protein